MSPVKTHYLNFRIIYSTSPFIYLINIMNLNVQKTPGHYPNKTAAPVIFPFSKANNHHVPVAYVKNLEVLL